MHEIRFADDANQLLVADYRNVMDIMIVKNIFDKTEFVRGSNSDQMAAHDAFNGCQDVHNQDFCELIPLNYPLKKVSALIILNLR